MAVYTGQIRQRRTNHGILATAARIMVGEPHPMFVNIFQLYDADTGKPCGGWSGRGIEKDYASSG